MKNSFKEIVRLPLMICCETFVDYSFGNFVSANILVENIAQLNNLIKCIILFVTVCAVIYPTGII